MLSPPIFVQSWLPPQIKGTPHPRGVFGTFPKITKFYYKAAMTCTSTTKRLPNADKGLYQNTRVYSFRRLKLAKSSPEQKRRDTHQSLAHGKTGLDTQLHTSYLNTKAS